MCAIPAPGRCRKRQSMSQQASSISGFRLYAGALFRSYAVGKQ